MSIAAEGGRDRRSRAVAAIVAAAVAAYLVARYLSPLVSTLVVGGALYYTVAPLSTWLARRRVPRVVSVLAIAVVLGGAAGVAVITLLPRVYSELEDFVGNLPAHLAFVERRLAESGLLGDGADPRVRRAVDALVDRSGSLVSGGLQRVFALAASALGSVTGLILGLILGLYLLLGAGDLSRGLAAWIPPDDRDRWTRFGREVSRAVGGYVRARVLAALFVGVSYVVAFTLLGVNQALLLGVVGGLFDLVPVIGPLLAAVPALIVAAFQGFGQALAVAVVMLAAQQIENGVLDPLLAGRMVRLSPVVMVLAVAAGSAAAGIPGMLVAVPVAAAMRSAFAIFYRERWEVPSP
jgi:predicted PurR-regulated permease PerM